MCAPVCHRCFLSGVLAPISPRKSQVVEAICILLCQKNPDAQMSSGAGKVTGLQLHVQVEVNTAAV